ncbi:MAG TPA: hypothetical protein VLL52_09275 [Anaerolineae bacterium]|nr:hypothetical protein [Anaerolineae bacterium]
MKRELSDTDPKIDAMIVERLRQMPVWRKWQLVADMGQMNRELALSGLRRRYPQATEEELKRLLADRILGEELALKAYGPRPELVAAGEENDDA